MGYQKIINLLGNTPNQPTKFRVKNWVEINDDARGTYITNSQIKFKTTMLRSILHDYCDAYILGIGTIAVASKERAASPTNREEKVISKNCAPFTDCKFEIYNTRVDNAKDIDEVMPV